MNLFQIYGSLNAHFLAKSNEYVLHITGVGSLHRIAPTTYFRKHSSQVNKHFISHNIHIKIKTDERIILLIIYA